MKPILKKSLASIANHRINEIRLNSQRKIISFSIFVGKSTLFPNFTIKENLLHQSKISALSELNDVNWTSEQRDYLKKAVLIFENFYPASIPDDLIAPISLLCTILRDTDYCLFTADTNITPIYRQISLALIDHFSEKELTTFINLEQSTENQIINFPQKTYSSLKKAS